MAKRTEDNLREAVAIAERLSLLLIEAGPQVAGMALSEMLALWLGGFPREKRAAVLETFMRTVAVLIADVDNLEREREAEPEPTKH